MSEPRETDEAAASTPRLAIILPARDEEATVGEVVRALRHHLLFEALPVARIIVVDNGSRDATARVAAAAGAELVTEPRAGYGAACLAGVRAADDCDLLLLMDADGSDDLDGAARVVRAVLDGEAELAMGSRTRGSAERGALTPQQRIGNALATSLLRFAYGLTVSDLGPTRAIRRSDLLRLDMRELGFGWSTEMLAKAARAGLRVREIPVDYHRRAGGRSKVAGTVRGTLRAGRDILGTLARYCQWQPNLTPQPPSLVREGGAPAELPPQPPSHSERRGSRVLAIVARLPVAGQVKTRLGHAIGHEAAAALYATFLRDLGTRFAAAAARGDYDLCWLCAIPEGATLQDFAPFVPPGGLLLAQEGDDLAARLWNGTRTLAASGYSEVVIIGSDSPHLPAARVDQAFAALATSQVTIGPAVDGGYYLLGQRTTPAPVDLFRDIQMSTSHVCSETLERAGALGLDVTLLPGTFDVDEIADLAQLRAALAVTPSAEAAPCPATQAMLGAFEAVPHAAPAGMIAGDER